MSYLIDADYTVYKNCASAEDEIDWGEDVVLVTSRFSEAYRRVERDIKNVSENLGGMEEIILFFSSPNNFRKKISPDYKGHRNRKKPCGYMRVINKLKENYKVVMMPTLEADDALGIWATRDAGEHIIVSPDKDMRQIPGKLYDLTNETLTITEEEGERWHYIQTMAGDCTDGYSGIPGIGIKRANQLLDDNGCNWDTVLEAYVDKGLTIEDALMNARLARILQNTDYDFKKEEPIPWNPTTTSSGANNGTELQDASN